MSTTNILKVSVLANGDLLLDGHSVALGELEQALRQGAQSGSAVWYYRENAAGEPPAVAMEVMRLITGNRLPVRLSAQPDFSDTLAPAQPGLEQTFATMREKAAQRQIVILRPDGRYLLLPLPEKGAAPPEAVASIERILPSSVKRNVAVIGETAWTTGTLSLPAANLAIPFFGLLMGLATIGHAVWIFDAATVTLLAVGCKDADFLIVDSASLESLSPGWQATAAKSMRSPQVLVHDRGTHRLRKP